MKVEVVCKNLECPTRVDRAQPQLVSCHKLRLGRERQIPVDEDNDPVGCPWCNMAVTIERISEESAQFALGLIEVRDDARKHLALGGEWLSEASVLVAWHVSGQYGSITEEVKDRNEEIVALLPFVRVTDEIISQFFLNGEFIWVATTPASGRTEVFGRESMEKRVQD